MARPEVRDVALRLMREVVALRGELQSTRRHTRILASGADDLLMHLRVVRAHLDATQASMDATQASMDAARASMDTRVAGPGAVSGDR